MYKSKVRYTDKQLLYFSLRDLITDIRCARLDHCEANPLLGYAEKCIVEFRALWPCRHNDKW
jgi:hypothetical protein